MAIQLIADCIAYRLPELLNEYLEFSAVNGFVSTIFKKLIIIKVRLTATFRNQARRRRPV